MKRTWLRTSVWLALMTSTSFSMSCSTAKKRPGSDSGHPTARAQDGGVYGPEPVGSDSSYGPEPSAQRGLVLMLGPGLGHTFAHAGVLKVLEQQHIPIQGLVATEMGALMAALYATTISVNEFEFLLFKLKSEVFKPEHTLLDGIMSHGGAANAALDSALKQIFGQKKFSDTRIPLRIYVQAENSSQAQVISTGLIWVAVREALGVPGWNPDFIVPGGQEDANSALSSAGDTLPFDVEDAAALASSVGEGVPSALLVAVDVLGTPAGNAVTGVDPKTVKYLALARAASDAILSKADVMIQPELGLSGYVDWSKRSANSYAGRKAALASLEEIKRKAGIQ